VASNNNIVAAYETVIADLSQDIGFDPGVLDLVLSALTGRLHEITEVWPFFDIVSQLEEGDD
jgi:hypothetical protein